MAVKIARPTTPGRRFSSFLDFSVITRRRSEKSLSRILRRKSGRGAGGKVTVRHQGGGSKRFFREVDFKRNKFNIPAKIAQIEYDPNRGANLALLHYADGEKRYILAPEGLKIGEEVVSGQEVEIKVGNTLPLKNIPSGMMIHSLELRKGKGGQLVRGAGTGALIIGKELKYAIVKLPSGEQRRIALDCLATIGQVGNLDLRNIKLGKAGRKRLMGWRPEVRGVSMNPRSHPHGGGEGRSGIGMPSPKTPWGKKTLGFKTRKRKKYSDKLIVKRRK